MSEWTIEGDETMRWDVICSNPQNDISQSEYLPPPVEDAFTTYVLQGGEIVSSRTHYRPFNDHRVYHLDTNAFVGFLIKENPPKR